MKVIKLIPVAESPVVLDVAEHWENDNVDPSEARLRTLLLDRVDGHPYVFDPHTATISLISEAVERAIRDVQDGNSDSDTVSVLATSLQLDDELSLPESGEELDALTIHLNHSCNLNCEYCYADGRTSDNDGTAKGAYGGPIAYMTPDTLRAALTKFMRDAKSDRVIIGFLGGEPLLSVRRFLSAVDASNRIAQEFGKRVRFELTTNGTLVTPEVVECLKLNGFSVAVSIDGDRETHDRQRPHANGKGTYDAALAGVTAMVEAGILVGVRMTAIRGRSGFEQAHYSLTDTSAPVANVKFNMYGEDAARSLDPTEESVLLTHYEEIAEKILDGDDKARKLTAVREVLAGIILKKKKTFQCGAGRWDRAVTPEGDVYPCHRFVGMVSYRMGNVNTDDFRFGSYRLFEGNALQRRQVRRNGTKNCARCYAQHVCGGGCAQIGAANTGKIGELPPFYCQETRLRVRAAVRTLVRKTCLQ